MQFNTYTVAGAHVAVWLVNHPNCDAAALTAELRRHDVHEPACTADDAAVLRPWTARLRALFESGAVAGKAELADGLLVAADCRPRLVSHEAGKPFHFHYAPAGTSLAARVRALTAAGLAHVIDEGGGIRLRACDRDGCGVAFLDTSRNGRRHFCSVRCANQVNVANHRRRQRPPSVTPAGADGPALLGGLAEQPDDHAEGDGGRHRGAGALDEPGTRSALPGQPRGRRPARRR